MCNYDGAESSTVLYAIGIADAILLLGVNTSSRPLDSLISHQVSSALQSV
jgi:hypothetical protein